MRGGRGAIAGAGQWASRAAPAVASAILPRGRPKPRHQHRQDQCDQECGDRGRRNRRLLREPRRDLLGPLQRGTRHRRASRHRQLGERCGGSEQRSECREKRRGKQQRRGERNRDQVREHADRRHPAKVDGCKGGGGGDRGGGGPKQRIDVATDAKADPPLPICPLTPSQTRQDRRTGGKGHLRAGLEESARLEGEHDDGGQSERMSPSPGAPAQRTRWRSRSGTPGRGGRESPTHSAARRPQRSRPRPGSTAVAGRSALR